MGRTRAEVPQILVVDAEEEAIEAMEAQVDSFALAELLPAQRDGLDGRVPWTDARCAEVVEYQGKRHFRAVYDYPNEDMRQPDEKAQINRFLSEYLALCLSHGVAAEAPALEN